MALAMSVALWAGGCSPSASDSGALLEVAAPEGAAETDPSSTLPPTSVRSTTALEVQVAPEAGSSSGEQDPDQSTEGAAMADDPAIPEPGRPLPTSSSALVTELTRAERALRSSGYSEEQLSAIGRWQQALYRHLSFHPEWLDAVLGTMPPDVAAAVALNWEARENLQALLATHTIHHTMPAWRIVDPSPAAELLSYYKEAERTTGIDWEYVAAINLVETRMGRIRGISTAGAIGPMQFLPTTWAECCQGDPTDPRDAIIGAATYLTHRGGPENMSKAIWGYNNSDYYVNAVTAYAEVMRQDERAYFGYHGWGVYFLTTEGVIFIEEGYEQPTEIPVTDWLARRPETLVTGS
jgi:hypothetical protein